MKLATHSACAAAFVMLCTPPAVAQAPSTPATQADPAVVSILDDFRRTAALYRLKYDFNRDRLTGADPKQLALYPFSNAWPNLVAPVVREPEKYRLVGASGENYTDEPNGEVGFVFRSPVERGLVPQNTTTLLLLGGVAKSGGVVANNYVSVYVRGDMAGLLNLQSYSTTIVRGNLTGTLYCNSYANVVVWEKTTGDVTFTNSCNAYLLGGFAGRLTLERGAKVFLGGTTLEAALAKVSGAGLVFLEASDLKPGRYNRGDVEIVVLEKGEVVSAATPAPVLPPAPAVVVTPQVPRHLRPFYEGKDAEDVADMPQQDLRAGGNPAMRYALIGPRPGDKAPENGYKLLLILPGGDGSPDFNPFVRRIAKNALPPGYLVAHLVAPVWNDAQGKNVVWPTTSDTSVGAGFTTETFVASVVKDAGSKMRINSKAVFGLGWSSGGLPVYASLLSENSPLTGAFVAMSVFRPQSLPPLTTAKGKAVYLLHSPQDFIKIRMAEAARDQLAQAGAKTKLTLYEGGHGWHGDVFGNISEGIEWLEANTMQP